MTKSDTNDNLSVGEFIIFRVGVHEYCIDIMAVREIRGWTPATTLPHAPSYVRGVINLRGAVLPIMDLAERLGFPPCTPTARNVIIVVQIGGQCVGLLVDAVSDIVTQSLDSVQPTPDVAADIVKAFVRGVLVTDGRIIGVMKLDNLLQHSVEEAA